jgi:hypothetical protein
VEFPEYRCLPYTSRGFPSILWAAECKPLRTIRI